MLTTKDLKKEEKRLEAEKKQQEADQKKRDAAWRKKYLAEKAEDARRFVDGPLDEIIKKADAAGVKTIRLNEFRAWKPDLYFEGWTEYYSLGNLGFDPNYCQKAAKIVIDALEEGGFSAKVDSRSVGNIEFYGDGEYRHDGTYSTEYFIEIAW